MCEAEPMRDPRRLAPLDVARIIFGDAARLYAHATDESAKEQSPENLTAFFRSGLEAVTKTAGLLVVALETQQETLKARSQQPRAATTQPRLILGAEDPGPLTYADLHRAVCVLTQDTKARVWVEHEAAEPPATVAEAVGTVQRATKALQAFFAAMLPAAQLHQERGEQAPSAVASGAAAEAAAALISAFADHATSAAPFAALSAMLIDVMKLGHQPRFSRAANAEDNRGTAFWRECFMGDAAIALDARWQAEKLEAADGKRRRVPAVKVARIVADAVGDAYRKTPDDEAAGARLVMGWREQAMMGHRGKPKGFKPKHAALDLWRRYLSDVLENPAVGGRWTPDDWRGFATRIERRLVTESGLKGRVQNRDLGRRASRSQRKAS